MAKIYDDHKFEAVLARFKDQAELSHRLTLISLKVFIGFLTVQFIMGSWLALNRDKISHPAAMGLLIIDITLAILAIKILYNQRLRRGEVIGTIRNCSKALGYEDEGVYLDSKPLNAPSRTRYWFP